jgi:aspartyl-tRNA(Asn)/glutamyl-tRNA(Gln) amidotransferase subunit C
MSLSVKDIEHIARLARLTLNEQEINQYRREISGIVRYVDKLAEINISKVEATARLTEEENALRTDLALPWDREETKNALAAASAQENKQIVVPRVFGDL